MLLQVSLQSKCLGIQYTTILQESAARFIILPENPKQTQTTKNDFFNKPTQNKAKKQNKNKTQIDFLKHLPCKKG